MDGMEMGKNGNFSVDNTSKISLHNMRIISDFCTMLDN